MNVIKRFVGQFLQAAGLVWGKHASDPTVTTGTVATWYNSTSDKWKGQNEAGNVKTFATEEALASGVTFTQTYSAASATVAAQTAVAVTDSTGGSSGTTLAAVTAPTALTHSVGTADGTVDDVGGAFNQTTLNNNFKELTTAQAANRAAIVALTNAVASLATLANANKADDLALRQNVNKVIDAIQAANIAG